MNLRAKPLLNQIAWIALSASPVVAAEAPVAGTPGTGPDGETVAACPTFHWGSVSSVDGYELVVYRLDAEGDESEVALRRSFPGAIDGWTAPIGSCLEPGVRYAWAVRGIGPDGPGPWSSPNLFRVAPGPSEAELEQALAVVREYLEHRGTALEPDPSGAAGSGEAGDAPTTAAPPRGSGGLAPRSHAGSGGAIVVDGAVAETKADPPCHPASAAAADAEHRFIDCGNGTVHDTLSGVVWLEDASCGGELDWYDANAFAAGLADGQCGLSDHSQPGDWRLPTFEEWESIFVDTCPEPHIAGRAGKSADQCFGDDPANEWASGVTWGSSVYYWSSTTEFESGNYAWSARLDGPHMSGEQKLNTNKVWPVRKPH
ncbi:MAG: DUF1566 domain-containing protein [bacterium]